VQVKCLKQASARLRLYIEQLNDQIVKIVESEADEFLTVGAKMEGVKSFLSDLKESQRNFQKEYSSQRHHAESILTYLSKQYAELKEMLEQRQQLTTSITHSQEY